MRLKRMGLAFAAVLLLGLVARAQTFTTLYAFTGPDGAFPRAGVIQDPTGNLYGTTEEGEYPDYYGVVYEVNTAGTETVLFSFRYSEGQYPEAPLVRDKAGNLYGTTTEGGTYSDGTVFRIDTAGAETVLYSFTGFSDGCRPLQGLVLGKSGTLFGTASECGSFGVGTIFKIDRAGNFFVLHSFTGKSSDGEDPAGGHLTVDNSGNLYGVTAGGGALAAGVLYKLSPKRKLTVLHSFGKKFDGCNPFGSVVQDTAGNLYGTTGYCGSHHYGTI